MSPAEIRTRALAEARYPGQEVWCHASPPRGRASERHYILCGYILCGRTRTADFTLGGGACGCNTPEAAWAAAEASLRREVEARIASDRRQRDLLDAEIARLTAALEVAT